VPGSEWFLVSRIDAAELRAGSLKNATWICAAGGLALIGLLAAGFLGRERRALGMAQDLQRLQAERLHALSLVQSIAEASSDAIFAKDLDGRYLLCNREACRLLGVTPQTVLGADDHSLFPPEQADLLRNNDARVLADNAVRSYEESLSTRDGERIFLVIKGPLHDEQGHVVGVFGISRDITDREHQRTSLAEAENTQRLLLAAMGDGMFVAQDHRFLFSNPALPRMLGREPAGFVDVPFAEVVAPESLAQWTERFEARVGDGPEPDRHYEVQFLRAGGPSRIWIDLRATRMELKGRRAVLGLVTDITERRRTAQALVHATELLRAVEDSLLDQLAVIDQQGCITAVNEAWRRFARDNGRVEGAPDDIGRDYFSVCGDDPLGREVVLGLRAVLDGSSAHFHIVYPCHSPSRERWFQLDATPLSVTGGGAVVMHSDITTLRQANDELDRHRHRLQDLVDAQTLRLQDAIAELLQSRNRAEAANHAKSAFLANMSHEIRTPMNAIIGLNYLVRRDGVTPAQASRLNRIDSAGQHLLAIINDILDLSKIEAGRVQIETIDFALSDVLDGVASIIAESARAKGLAITVDSNAVPPWLRGDPTRLRQALLNFAGNAVKFTESGSITLNAKMLRDGGSEMLVQFSVTDTGIGIAAEKIPRLFKPFEQADASITRKFGGTGLGLAITKRLADLMQGECGVHSEEGIGSTFWFTAIVNRGHLVLPVASPESSSTDRDLMREYHRDARLLLAEDNEVNREVALAMLDGVGLSVDVATNGQEAVAMAREHRYDLILMDMQMPEMSGLEATRAIRQLPGWATQPILALTANAFDDDRLACKAAGMNDFIVKPINVDALYSTILKWLDAAVEKAG
jgi:PAS domain S-box-containing protein